MSERGSRGRLLAVDLDPPARMQRSRQSVGKRQPGDLGFGNQAPLQFRVGSAEARTKRLLCRIDRHSGRTLSIDLEARREVRGGGESDVSRLSPDDPAMKEKCGGRKRQRGGDLRRDDGGPDPAEPEAAAPGRRLPKPGLQSAAGDLQRGENANDGRAQNRQRAGIDHGGRRQAVAHPERQRLSRVRL